MEFNPPADLWDSCRLCPNLGANCQKPWHFPIRHFNTWQSEVFLAGIWNSAQCIWALGTLLYLSLTHCRILHGSLFVYPHKIVTIILPVGASQEEVCSSQAAKSHCQEYWHCVNQTLQLRNASGPRHLPHRHDFYSKKVIKESLQPPANSIKKQHAINLSESGI